MANYYATARSNYFAVKDETKFRQWAESHDLEVMTPNYPERIPHEVPRFAITPSDDSHHGGWPGSRFNEETQEDESIALHEELSLHLADGEVAVLMEIGNEKLRYLIGYTVAVNNKGETASMDLNAIYELAKPLGKTLTEAEY